MTWTLLLQGVLALNIKYVSSMIFKDKEFPVQKLNQEDLSGVRQFPYHAPWLKESDVSQHEHGRISYPAAEASYMGYSINHLPLHTIGYIDGNHMYQKLIPNTFAYMPNFTGKESEFFHILPPSGKSIRELQEEADMRLKKILFESRENQKIIEDKIQKLKSAYGFGTIGYPGYKNTIKYEPINLGIHKVINLGAAIEAQNGNLKLPMQTVRVTNTLGVPVPQPYPVAIIKSHPTGDISHIGTEVPQSIRERFFG